MVLSVTDSRCTNYLCPPHIKLSKQVKGVDHLCMISMRPLCCQAKRRALNVPRRRVTQRTRTGQASYGGDSSSVQDQLRNGVVSVASNWLAFAVVKVTGSIVTWGGDRDYATFDEALDEALW